MLRDAGYNERRCIARDVLGLYGCIATVARYDCVATVTAVDLRQQLVAALQRCLHKHAALATVVKNATSEKPVLAQLEDIDVGTHLTILGSMNDSEDATSFLQKLLCVAHAQPLDDYETRPQWRVWALPIGNEISVSSCYLAFATSHAIMDGRSGTIFHGSMLEALNNKADITKTASSTPDTRLAPALDQAATFPISWSFLLRPLLEEKLPSRVAAMLGLATTDVAWCGAAIRPALPTDGHLLRTAIQVLLIKPATLVSLLAACRTQKTKLTALLNIVISQSLAVALRRRGQSYARFATSTPYDLRRLIPESAGQIANYVSAVDQTVIVNTGTSPQLTKQDWQQVREATSVLQERSATLNDQPVALLNYLSNFKEWVSKRASQPSKESFSVSNLGSFNAGSSAQNWTISHVAFSQSADATGTPLNVNVASSDKGTLSIVLTWWPGMLGVDNEAGFVREVSDDLAARLERIALATP